MTVQKVTDFFVPELLAEAVKAGFAGMKALWGTDAAVVNFAMPAGKTEVGTTVKVPYFTSLGEMEDLTNDGDALTPAGSTSAAQTATVKHSGKAFEITHWAQLAALGDPYELAAQQVIESARRRGDKALIDAAADATSWSSLTHDISAVGAGTINYDDVIKARMKWGDEQDAIALMVVNSKVFGDALSLKDALGRPLLTDINEGGISKFAGIPMAVSDRIVAASSVYTNLLIKKNALALWLNGQPSIITQPDVLTDSTIAACHIYWAAHRYNPMAGLTKGGVIRFLTK